MTVTPAKAGVPLPFSPTPLKKSEIPAFAGMTWLN
jgi:hypothetical protein